MAQLRAYAADTEHTLPAIRTIDIADIKDALAKGLDDFWAMPSQMMFLGILYPIMGFLLADLALGYNVLPLVFPLVAGFALVGPVAATGLYEMSRRRERGQDVTWAKAFGVLRSPAMRPIATIGALLMAMFIAWLYVAQGIYSQIFGEAAPASIADFVEQVLTTPQGWILMVVGNGVGFLFAVAAFCVSVVSVPMLLDRQDQHVGARQAVQTSVRAVLANPQMMALWGVIVAAGLVLGSLPVLIGLIVVMPILGHATWHLYRKVVAR